MRLHVTLLLVAGLCVVPMRAGAQFGTPRPLLQLRSMIRRDADHAPGLVAMEVRDLVTGYTSGFNADAVMPAASTIKIPVMVEVFKQMEEGRFDLNRRVELFEQDKDWGSGTLCDAPVGSTFPVSDLLTQMITVSDNTAANMLIRLVGRQRINETMADLGLHHTDLAGYIRTQEWSVRQKLRTTPADMVRLLTDMAKHRLVDEWASRQMIEILEHQEINTLLPEPLPEIPIAHKTGSFDDTLDDVGIVYAANEPYVIAVLTTHLPSLPAGRRFIRKVSRVTYTELERFARWREANDYESVSSDESTPSPVTAGDVPMWGPTPEP